MVRCEKYKMGDPQWFAVRGTRWETLMVRCEWYKDWRSSTPMARYRWFIVRDARSEKLNTAVHYRWFIVTGTIWGPSPVRYDRYKMRDPHQFALTGTTWETLISSL